MQDVWRRSWPAAALLALAAVAAAQTRPAPESTRSPATTTAAKPSSPGGRFGLAELKPLLPPKAGIWRQQAFAAKSTLDDGAAGFWVSGDYGAGPKKAKLTLTDLGDATPVAMPWSGPVAEPTEARTYSESGRTFREESRKSGRREFTIVLRNGIAIAAAGSNVTIAELKQLATGVDIGGAEALARPARK